jgi:chlorobactene glucosyltransferase
MFRLFARLSQATALLLLSFFTYRLWRNFGFLERARESARLPQVFPRVSVLVPARNEAQVIVACIDSLACQNNLDVEIIALNDQSSDETSVLLDELAAHHANLTVIHGTQSPPPGWNGKSYACHRLAERARGEWLLFTDADTVHTTASISQGIAQAEGLNVDLLSAFPRQITKTWSEQVIVSFVLDFLPLVGLDLMKLWRGSSSTAAANGQYLLVRASAYHALGGHQAISSALVDDFALANHFRSHSRPIALVDGTSMLECRMYHNTREVWEGFSKNILLALDMSSGEKRPWWQTPLFAWGYASLFVLPFDLLFTSYRQLSLVTIGWLAVLRAVVNWRLRRPLGEIVTTPLAAWSVMAFGLNALFRRVAGKQTRWKGRDYSVA